MIISITGFYKAHSTMMHNTVYDATQKISTPQQILQRLSITLTHLKTY